jgi:hypothetical protein
MSKSTWQRSLLFVLAPMVVVSGRAWADSATEPVTLEQVRLQVEADAARIAAEEPELYGELLRLRPRVTRGGMLRFTSHLVHDERATPIFLYRLLKDQEDPPTRRALAAALPRTGGDWSAAALALLRAEPEAPLRRVLVTAMRRAVSALARYWVLQGLRDSDPVVRATAATTAPWLPGHADVRRALLARLEDPVPLVQAEAARALGVLAVPAALGPLEGLLDASDVSVRLEALSALERLDVSAAAMAVRRRPSLMRDQSAAVRRNVRRILGERQP